MVINSSEYYPICHNITSIQASIRHPTQYLPAHVAHRHVHVVLSARAAAKMPGRMGKRLSQAPRMSIVNMAGVEEPERKHSVRDFLCANVKSIVTIIMIFGTILCIVLIVMGKL